MYNFYKVTSVHEKKTKKGDIVYNLQLNNSIRVNFVNPDKIWRSSGKDNPRAFDALNIFWINNNKSLEKLLGKYIAGSLEESDFGKQFSEIISVDMVNDFKILLDESSNRAFSTSMPIYSLLESLDYRKNNDNSITLKNPYDNFNINKHNGNSFNFTLEDLMYRTEHGVNTICYPKSLGKDVLTLDNIERICHHYGKSGNKYSAYAMTPVEIIEMEFSRSYKYRGSGKSNIKEEMSSIGIILRVGDKLSNEQMWYLSNAK